MAGLFAFWFARRDMRTTVKVCTARDEEEYLVMPASVAGLHRSSSTSSASFSEREDATRLKSKRVPAFSMLMQWIFFRIQHVRGERDVEYLISHLEKMDESASFSANFYFFACISIENAVYFFQRLRNRSLSLPMRMGMGIPARAAHNS